MENWLLMLAPFLAELVKLSQNLRGETLVFFAMEAIAVCYVYNYAKLVQHHIKQESIPTGQKPLVYGLFVLLFFFLVAVACYIAWVGLPLL